MGASEIAGRSRRMASHLADDALYRIARGLWRSGWYPAAGAVLGPPTTAHSPLGFMTPERGRELGARLPDEAERLLARAERALAREVRYFGYPQVVLDGASVADVDPFSGRAWPARHGKRVDYRHAPAGDPKWIWELNRCQELPLLSAAWLVSGEDPFGSAAAERMTAWIGAHPPGRGIAWSSGFEAGIRGISLALTLDALRGSAFLGGPGLELTLTSLWQHGRWIRRDPSLGSSANNHRIGELAGLVVIASLAPELRDSAEWLDEALQELEVESRLQIRSDGTSAEQAFSYHLFVADLLLVATAVLDARGRQVPEGIASALERSGDALWAQLGEGEPPPTYGDTDDGRAFVLDGEDLRDPRAVSAAIAARFEHPRARRASGERRGSAWWLFGEPGLERLEGTTPAPWPESVTLADAGLTILRREGVRTVFDHGPHGYTSLAAHAHADALTVDVSAAGEQLVVDPGVGSYFARPDVREAFRGTRFHATVTVDGLDSSVSGGPFMWTDHAHSRLLSADLELGFAVAEHDGYLRLPDPVSHRRGVVALRTGGLLVVDRLVAESCHRYVQSWPLHAELEVESCSAALVLARSKRHGVAIQVSASAPAEVAAVRGGRDPLAGWWSPRLESVQPSWVVEVKVEEPGPVELVTCVLPFVGAAVPDVRVETAFGPSLVRATVHDREHTEEIEVDLRSTPARIRREPPRP